MVKRTLSLLIPIILALAACSSSPTSANATPLSEQEAKGQQLFTQHCSSCHSTVGDAVIVGPSLAGIATRAETRVEGLSAHDYIEQSILDPSAFMVPGFDDLMPKTWGQMLTGEELDSLVAFLLTLK